MKITYNKLINILQKQEHMKADPLYSRVRHDCTVSLLLLNTLFKASGQQEKRRNSGDADRKEGSQS